MNAILVLLVLLSFATLASRRGFAAFVFHQISTPVLLGVGMVFAPRGLNLLPTGTLEALEPALRVGAAWLALLIGLRGLQPHPTRSYLRRAWTSLVASLFTWGGLSLIVYGMIVLLDTTHQGLDATFSRLDALGAALLLGGLAAQTGLGMTAEALASLPKIPAHRILRFLCRHDEAIGAVALCVALWLWPLSVDVNPIYAEPWQASLTVIVLGSLLGLAHLFTALGSEDNRVTMVALLGFIVLGTGLCWELHLPEAAVGFFFGIMLGIAGRGQNLLDQGLAGTERPVRLVLLVLIGAQLSVSIASVLLGTLLAVTRILLKISLRALFLNKESLKKGSPEELLPLRAIIPSGGSALPFALSFALSRGGTLDTSEILSAIAICVSITQVVNLVDWRVNGRDDNLDAHLPGAYPTQFPKEDIGDDDESGANPAASSSEIDTNNSGAALEQKDTTSHDGGGQ
ncbi:MAG: hypothetical protein GY822_15030 [Deltaproteobacteria bacterium]|nr:hypothetical protein [Deltaproteobacteria bacterium]